MKWFCKKIIFWFNDSFPQWLYDYIAVELYEWWSSRINYKWTQLKAIEKLLEYLLDNNLLWKKKK